MVPEEIRKEILERLVAGANIRKVIVFGSYASGSPGLDSDVDILVVTDDDSTPQNFEESMEHYHRISSVLREIKRRIPIDLIVHTKQMHEEFMRQGSMFAKEITERGEVLYEKTH
ncbi:MAG: nucleotidyltransferase domain-containing protein [Syntrophobacteraceae bacterium]